MQKQTVETPMVTAPIQAPELIPDHVPVDWVKEYAPRSPKEMLPAAEMIIRVTLNADDLDTRQMLFKSDVDAGKY